MLLITGAKGQLGTELTKLLDENNVAYYAADVQELDITNRQAVDAFFTAHKPTFVYHCAAYTAVDKAEDEGKEMDELINVVGTENIARACAAVGATLVYISTDYIFDGTKKDGQYATDDTPNPQNEYGRTKLLGEQMVAKYLQNYYIIRTSWVFGKYGHNFVYTMRCLAETHDKITVVNDQFGRPTWTRNLAEFMLFVKTNDVAFGTYHFSNDNSCSWFEFATEILKDFPTEVLPVTSSEYPQKATRPQYSVMDLSKTKATGFTIPTWQEALAQMVAEITE